MLGSWVIVLGILEVHEHPASPKHSDQLGQCRMTGHFHSAPANSQSPSGGVSTRGRVFFGCPSAILMNVLDSFAPANGFDLLLRGFFRFRYALPRIPKMSLGIVYGVIIFRRSGSYML